MHKSILASLLTLHLAMLNAKADVDTPPLDPQKNHLSPEQLQDAREQARNIRNKLNQDKSFKERADKINQNGLPSEGIASVVSKYNSGAQVNLNKAIESPSDVLYSLSFIKFKGTKEDLSWLYGIIKNNKLDENTKYLAILALPRASKTEPLKEAAVDFATQYYTELESSDGSLLERKSLLVVLAKIGDKKSFDFIKNAYMNAQHVDGRLTIARVLITENQGFFERLKNELSETKPERLEELNSFADSPFKIR